MEPESPRLPAKLKSLEPEPGDVDGASWFQREIDTADLSGARADEAEIEQCRLVRVTLAGAHLRHLTVVDTEIDHGDWANATLDESGLRRVPVKGSRMTGLSCIGSVVRDAEFRECKLDLSNWRASVLHTVHFVQCDLAGADFSGAELRGVRFSDCNLNGAQFSQVKVQAARFEECDLSGVGGVASLAGAHIRTADLFSLTGLFAQELGITVEPSEH